SLSHPSIVHVIDAGHTMDGRPYLAMEYVEGTPIDVFAKTLDVNNKLRLFLHVCEAVSHAHRRLIIHRDLKPSNILVNSEGLPKLLDFGIATLLDDTRERNQTVDRLLTPNYASPEQLPAAVSPPLRTSILLALSCTCSLRIALLTSPRARLRKLSKWLL